MGPNIQVGDLAQRALGDAFDQLVRVGSAGSGQCHRYSQIPYSEAQRIDAATARAMLDSAANALRYAEHQLRYLALREPVRPCSAHAGVDQDEGSDAAAEWTSGGRALAAPDSGP